MVIYAGATCNNGMYPIFTTTNLKQLMNSHITVYCDGEDRALIGIIFNRCPNFNRGLTKLRMGEQLIFYSFT